MSIPISPPDGPGVYFFRDKNGKVLYLGKAANLKSRLKSYFDKSPKNPRLLKMLEIAKDVDWQEAGFEVGALIMESQLIKKYRPPFNIMLRDDKQYFYVVFTKEKFPKIFITHQPAKQQKTKFSQTIGPFTDGTALRVTLKLLRRIFPYCTCKQKHNNYCMNYQIGNCLGFCCLKNKPASKQIIIYKKNAAAIKSILNGKKKSLIKEFEKEMNALAKRGNLEKAIELRDKIEKLKRVFENARIVRDANIQMHANDANETLAETQKIFKLNRLPRRIEGYDVSNIQGEFATGAMVVFTDGRPDKNEYRKFKIHSAGGDTAMLEEIITRRFGHPEWAYPDLILIDGGKGQLSAAVTAMSNVKIAYSAEAASATKAGRMSKKIPVIALTKNVRHRGDHIYTSTKKSAVPLQKLSTPARNLILQIDTEAHRFAIGYYRKLHRKNI